jgi:AcrR family transcriptional regulator
LARPSKREKRSARPRQGREDPRSGETRVRILEAAERLFERRGPELTSVRSITAEAGVNVAAVHYHFGSRRGLFHEMAQRRFAAIRSEQLSRLEALERRGKPQVEEILRVLVEPTLDAFDRDPVLRGLIGWVGTEPEIVGAVEPELWGPAVPRFQLSLARALPALTPEEISTRFAFAASIIMKVVLSRRGVLDARTPEGTGADEIVAFTAAGMRAASGAPVAARAQRRAAS